MSGPIPVHLIASLPDYHPAPESRIKLRHDRRPEVPYVTGYVAVEIDNVPYTVRVIRGHDGKFSYNRVTLDMVVKEALLNNKEVDYLISLCID